MMKSKTLSKAGQASDEMSKQIQDQELAKAIYGAVAFFDIFSRPLNLQEIYKYLYKKRASQIEIEVYLKENKRLKMIIGQDKGYYHLRGRRDIVREFLKRKKYTRKFWAENLIYIRLLKLVPFIKMIGIGGSFARETISEISDLDLYIVAQNHRIYLAQAFINFFNRKVRASRNLEKELFPVALIFSKRHMKYLKQSSSLASELLSIKWLLGDTSPVDILDENKWIGTYFPNGYRSEIYQKDYPIFDKGKNIIVRFFEWILGGKIGDYLESYFRNKMVNKVSADFEDEYWAEKERIRQEKGERVWIEPERLVDKLIKNNL